MESWFPPFLLPDSLEKTVIHLVGRISSLGVGHRQGCRLDKLLHTQQATKRGRRARREGEKNMDG